MREGRIKEIQLRLRALWRLFGIVKIRIGHLISHRLQARCSHNGNTINYGVRQQNLHLFIFFLSLKINEFMN